jgi:uncharacterized repeat protein (TIGR02543 family)
MNTKKVFLLTLSVLCIISALLPSAALADPGTHTVTFLNPDGTGAAPPASVADGTAAARPADPVLDRHQFTGWFTDAGCTAAWVFNTPVTSDITLYAGWLDIYAVTASMNGAFGVVAGGGDYVSGSAVTLTASPSPGYRFVQWAENGIRDAAYSFTVSADITLTAVFEAITVPSLSASSSGYKSIVLNWTPVPGAAGYSFTGRRSLTENTAS